MKKVDRIIEEVKRRGGKVSPDELKEIARQVGYMKNGVGGVIGSIQKTCRLKYQPEPEAWILV